MKIVLNKGQRLFFTSDTHYSHTGICRGTTKWRTLDGQIPVEQTRPFDSLEEMNDRLVAGINASVGEDDILVHLGDWSFGGFENIEIFRNRLNCKNIHLILGNHDHHIKRNKGGVQKLFSSVNRSLTLDVELPRTSNKDKKISHTFELFHFPIASWENMNDGVIHICGHVHLPPDKRLFAGKAMDVGVDGNNMDPISMEEVLSIMKNQPIKKLDLPSDHHDERLRT